MNTEQYCLHLNLGDESSKYATLTEMPSRGIELTDEVEKWKQNKTDLAISLIPFDWVAYKGFRHYVTIQPSQCSIFGNLRKMRQAIRYIKKVTKGKQKLKIIYVNSYVQIKSNKYITKQLLRTIAAKEMQRYMGVC